MKQIILAIFLFLALACSINAQEKVYIPIALGGGCKVPKCDRTWRIVKPDGMTNFVKNPSAETTGNFAAEGGTTVTRVTTFSHYGLYSYRIQSNADDEGIEITLSSLSNAAHFVTMRVRGKLPPVWDWSLDDTTYLRPELLETLDAEWTLYGTRFPASQANGSTKLSIHQNGNGDGDFYLDGIQVEDNTYWTMYCDGTQNGCEWNGVADASTSTRSAVSRAGGIVQDLWTDYGFFAEEIIGAGAAVQSLNVRSFATLPGGELSGSKIEPREFTIIGRFIGESEADLHAKRQELLEELSLDTYPASQPVLVNFTGAIVQKQISVIYQGGLEARLNVSIGKFQVESDDEWRILSHWTEKVSIQFLSPNPFWLEIGESSVELDTNDSATFTLVAARLRSTGQWDNLGPPNAAGTYAAAYAIAEDDTYVYFGGEFTNFDNIAAADNIVRYNKQTGAYSALDVGLNGTVRALAISPTGDLYIGGFFTNAGGVGAADYLTRWDGTDFFAVGTPNAGAAAITSVNALVFDPSGDLIIGGNFTNWANIAAADFVASWDGTSHSALASGINSLVNALAVTDANLLYLGGDFTAPETRVMSWDGSSFSALSTGMNGGVNALTVTQNGFLYATGSFTTAGGESAARIAVWNGTGWSSLGSGLGATGIGLDSKNNNIFVTGTFITAGDLTLGQGLARWNGSSWAHVDLDLDGEADVDAILIGSSDPVVEALFDIWIMHTTDGATGFYGGLTISTNDGTAVIFPKIIYNRSGGTSATLATLRNETTGLELLFDYDLLDGETLTIDLNPTSKSITSSMFGNRIDAVLANSDFGTWSLLPDDNNVTSFVDVAGGPTITAWMLWKDTYKSFD